jgi:excinuclease ABC subunit C
MNVIDVKKLNIPRSPGVYQFKDKSKKVIYIGKASNLKNRIFSYYQKSASHSPAKYSMLKQVKEIDWIETDSEIEALLLEVNLIKKYQPEYNVLMRDDKRYIYIKISLEDEIPGVFITRKIDKSGRYFGPFTSVEPVKQTLKAIRKIWPYCNRRRKRSKACFYYQINRCLGICGGVVGKKEYMEKAIKPIILFLEGRKGRMVKNYELRIKNYEEELKKYKACPPIACAQGTGRRVENEKFIEIQEKVNLLKYQLFNLRKVLEHTKILSLSEKYESDVVELAKVLELPKVPERIEGYDISNIFGKEAVGSMVVFKEGEPEKSEYRRFKIKLGPSSVPLSGTSEGKQGDIQMLKEVLERRFKGYTDPELPTGSSGSDKWSLPDLIIIDGGKAQLNVAMRVLKNFEFNIPVIAISKGAGLRSAGAPDKLFFPSEKKPLELPLASPALHLIKRVRDEAHRFAIFYHRRLKKKKLYIRS